MKKVLSDPGFRVHLIIYLCVNAFLLFINLLGDANHLWFYWPLLGWGIGVAAHGFAVSQKPKINYPTS